MAGEFEEPISIGFRADSLLSGSISFGRLESEELSWERRSSFSHNRYLEEVEKYSKPGLVIEKKAYFEAHFKKKGILLPGSPEGYNQRVHQSSESSENDVLEHDGHREEYETPNQSTNYSHFQGNALENADYGEFDNGNEGGQSVYINDSMGCFDKSPEDSEQHGECEVTECDREDTGVVCFESQEDSVLDNNNISMERVLEDVKPEEAHQTETGSDELRLDDDRQEVEIEQSLNDNASNVDESYGPIDSSIKGEIDRKVAKTGAVHQENLASKVKAPSESKSVKPRLKSKVNGSQVQKTICSNASKTPMKSHIREESNTPLRTKSEKQSQKVATPTRLSLTRTPKREDSESCNSRLHHWNKSKKELKLKKVTESQTSGSKKVEHGAHQSTNRLKQTVSSTKPETRLSASAFNFKSEERAEKRKEFYTKLEEKIHAKEAEMNQIQARTQEKVESEMKQFRKSLSFKATPMPSFYHTPATNNAVVSKIKPVKERRKSISPGNGAAAGSKWLSKAGNDQASSTSESVKATDLPESSGITDCPTEPDEACESSTNNNSPVSKTRVTSKKDQEMTKDSNSQKQRVSDSSRVSKEKKVESKPKTRNHGNGSEVVRKNMKSIGIGSNSGMARLPVGVAS